MTTPAPRPTPLHDIANLVGPAIGIASTMITAAAGSGLLPKVVSDKSPALVNLLKLLPPVVGGVFALLSAKAVAVAGTPQVTPVASPQDNAGNLLKPVDSLGKLLGF